MTDMDAACLLRELRQYNLEGKLSTPQNASTDTTWDCAFDHAIRALLRKAGYQADWDKFKRNPNGSYSVETEPAPAPASWQNVTFEKTYPSIGCSFQFRLRIKTAAAPIDIAKALKRETKGEIPDGLPAALGRACRKNGWEFELLDRNVPGFPADLVVRA